MNINNTTMQTDLLDILFANRNKSYGAYQLRKEYSKRLSIAVAVMFFVCLLFSVMYRLQAAKQYANTTSYVVSDIINLKDIQPKDKPVILPPPIKQIHIEQHLATIKVTPPRIVSDDQVTTPPPTTDDMVDVKIDVTTTDGIKGDITAPPVEEGTGAVQSLVKMSEPETEVHFVQQEARFKGGMDAWKNFLERNLRSSVPLENGAAAGSYTVVVSFLVDKSGSISEVKAENDPGFGTAAEAVRVIQRGPAWIPAVQNGRNVIYRQRQAITFVVEQE